MSLSALPSCIEQPEDIVLRALTSGELVDLIGNNQADHRVSLDANLVRSIMTGTIKPEGGIDPKGLRIRGARFDQTLDLDHVEFDHPVEFLDCDFDAGISAYQASLDDLIFQDTRIRPVSDEQMSDPSITEAAIRLDQATIKHNLTLDKCRISGTVYLRLAHIGGNVGCKDGTWDSSSGPALHADGIVTIGNFALEAKITGNGDAGAVRLLTAHIGGQLQVNSNITNLSGPAFGGDGLTIGDNLFLEGQLTGDDSNSAVRLFRTHVDGQLICDGEFTNKSGPALSANGLIVQSGMSLNGVFTGSGDNGAVSLVGAQVAGQLICAEGGKFTNKSGPALCAVRLSAGAVYLKGAFNGANKGGAISLSQAHIHGELSFLGSDLGCSEGPALVADALTVDSDMGLAGKFEAVDSSLGTVCIRASHIGQLFCVGSLLCRVSNEHTNIADSSVAGLDLSDTSVDSSLFFNKSFRNDNSPKRWLNLDGLTYRGIPNHATDRQALEKWIAVLRDETVGYTPQPWQQLARAWQTAGHPQEATKVLIAQQDDRRARQDGHPKLLWWTKKLIGYGYLVHRPWVCLAVLALIGVMASVLLTGSIHAYWPGTGTWTTLAAHPPISGDPATTCSLAERVGLGLDWTVPLVSFADNACQVNMEATAGQIVAGASWVLRLLGWFFASLGVAGFTGIVRRV